MACLKLAEILAFGPGEENLSAHERKFHPHIVQPLT